jgi:type II secretory pathway component PulC
MITRPRASVPEPAPDPIAEPDPEAVKALRTPTRLYGTAKVKPVYRLHDVEGARITNIGPGSFWDLLGVHEGDVVIELHGDPVDTPADLVALMNVLERDEHVAIAVRGTDGEVRYLDFRIPGEETR